jgi:hypothetical protein
MIRDQALVLAPLAFLALGKKGVLEATPPGAVSDPPLELDFAGFEDDGPSPSIRLFLRRVSASVVKSAKIAKI